jgi:hypothetical protein
MSRAVRVSAGSVLAILWLILGSWAARADIALCPMYSKPASDTVALRRSASAFEGVVIAGRKAGNGSSALISPLSFRVTRWFKGWNLFSTTLPSGVAVVRMWDGRYARLPATVLESYSQELRRTFPGEIRTRLGQRWRIYATNENGVNFTCTEYLGSHVLGVSSSPGSPRGLDWRLVVIPLGGAIVIGLLVVKLLASRRRPED